MAFSSDHAGGADLSANAWHAAAQDPLGGANPPSNRDQETIRASKERERARIVFDPKPITELGPSEPPQWIWPGYVAKGHMTLFTGLWKAGKSTLIGHLLRDLQRGAGLVTEACGLRTLVLAEESPTHWTLRREELELGDSVHIACRPFRTFPNMSDWEELIKRTVEYVARENIDFVIFDTLSKLWPVLEENDAGKVIAALMPLQNVIDTGASIMLVHHPRKGDAGEGQASRGSGALPGAVDVILEFRRSAPNDASDRRRLLTAYSRFEETPRDVVLELGEAGYTVLGDRSDAQEGRRLQIIQEILSKADTDLTADDVFAQWPDKTLKPGRRAVDPLLDVGLKRQLWQRTGRGVKGNPYKYGRFDSPNLPSIGARIESGGTQRPKGGGK